MRKPKRTSDVFSNVLMGVGAIVLAGVIALHFYNTWQREFTIDEPPIVPPGPSIPEPERSAGRAGHVIYGSICLANTGQSVPESGAIYRWKDAQGVPHYSDRPPSGDGAVDLAPVVQQDVEPVTLNIDARGTELPIRAKSRAIADAVALGKIFSDTLGLRTDRKLALKAIIAGSDAVFREAAPNPISQTGVYIGAERLIVVRAQADPDRTMSILRHEITHAVIHEWVGRLPTALNEGLAEYFEAFESSAMGGVVKLDQLERRFASIPPSRLNPNRLAELLSAPDDTFYGYDEDNNYVQSAALVATLLASADGRSRLGQVLQAQARQPCVPIDPVALFSRGWPGGWSELASAWRAMQLDRDVAQHAY